MKNNQESTGSQRVANNEHLYRSLEKRFDESFRRDAKSLQSELLGKVSQPKDILSPAEVPILLESGIAAGPNPFNDVCEYLEHLAERLP